MEDYFQKSDNKIYFLVETTHQALTFQEKLMNYVQLIMLPIYQIIFGKS